MNVVAGLFPISINRGRNFLKHLLREDCDNTRFTFWTLPRAVHISVAEDDVGKAVEFIVKEEIVFRSVLADAIGCDGKHRCLLVGGQVFRLSVNCPPGGSVDETLHFVPDRQFEQMN